MFNAFAPYANLGGASTPDATPDFLGGFTNALFSAVPRRTGNAFAGAAQPVNGGTSPSPSDASAIDVAGSALGLNETTKKAALDDFLTTGGANLDPSVTAWCAAFVNASLAQAGGEGTGSNLARSFLNWGSPVETPQRGDVAVFSRGDPSGPFGHVGFFDSFNPDGSIRVLGGNQSDAVGYGNYSPNALLGFRRG